MKVTTDEALSILDQLAAATKTDRQSHFAFQEAIVTLRVALTKEVDVPEPSRDGAKEETVVD